MYKALLLLLLSAGCCTAAGAQTDPAQTKPKDTVRNFFDVVDELEAEDVRAAEAAPVKSGVDSANEAFLKELEKFLDEGDEKKEEPVVVERTTVILDAKSAALCEMLPEMVQGAATGWKNRLAAKTDDGEMRLTTFPEYNANRTYLKDGSLTLWLENRNERWNQLHRDIPACLASTASDWSTWEKKDNESEMHSASLRCSVRLLTENWLNNIHLEIVPDK